MSLNRLALMSHLVAGYPSLATTRELILAMQAAGVDILEIQIPFSDPLGDGPVIREACSVALQNGLKIPAVFELLKTMRAEGELTRPFYVMAYFNSVYNFGGLSFRPSSRERRNPLTPATERSSDFSTSLARSSLTPLEMTVGDGQSSIEKFCTAAKSAGAEGLIIPDYTAEAEAYDHLFQIAEKHNLNCIQFLSLDSTEETIARVAKNARGFVYCFSMRGITGSESENNTELLQKLTHLKQKISAPLAVGFGISTPEQVKLFSESADIVIVGSAFIRAFQSGGVEGVRKKVEELVAAL